jgi:polar amino acid transport system substrate-binding protein
MPPLNMTTKDGDIIGLDVDLAHRIAQGMGVKLRIVPMPFSDLLPSLDAGKVDMVLSQMTITPERNMRVAFVGPYLISGKSLLTKTTTLLSVKSPKELDSPRTHLTALLGSTSQKFVETLMPRASLTLTKDYDTAVKMVIEDKADAMVADYPICVFSVLRYPESGLAALTTPMTYEPIGIAVPANDPLLVNCLENMLVAMDGSKELESLTQKWFKDAAWLKRLP